MESSSKVPVIQLQDINGKKVIATTSLTVADFTGKDHRKVVRDIDKLIQTGRFSELDVELSTYLSSRGKTYRMYILSPEPYDFMIRRYEGQGRMPFTQREKIALSTIEQLLDIKLIRQYVVGGFRVDGYDLINNVVYEIDEEQHNTPAARKRDYEREAFIKKHLGCTFKRIKV